jgi:NAD(P)-dependent dehydrogenase (short-subunit alcohol dehydrogenase family)
MRLEDKIAVITGAARGIGREVALIFAREGATVVINDIDTENLKNVAEEIKAIGQKTQVIEADVSSSKEVSEMAAKVLGQFKKVDILVNNAGVDIIVSFQETTEAIWDDIISTNLKGTFLCCKAFGEPMIKQKRGKIVNFCSTLAHVGVPKQVAYAASKGGILQFTRALATEWAEYNINVNAVSPGATMTSQLAAHLKVDPVFYQSRARRIPLRRINEPQHIAQAVLFLASPESDNVTGQDIIVDGGSVALHSGYTWPERPEV